MDVDVSGGWAALLVVALVWDAVWRGMALWRAARNNHTGWFVALMVINSVGILPIVYLVLHRTSGAQSEELRP